MSITDERTEAQVAVSDTEFAEMRERQGRVEQNVEQLSTATRQVVETQQQQQAALSSLTSDVQSILTLLRTREGRVDVKVTVTILGCLLGVLGPIAGMFIAPITRDVSTLQTAVHELAENGAPSIRARMAVNEERYRASQELINRIDGDARRRLEEEAAIGRAALLRAAQQQAPQEKTK